VHVERIPYGGWKSCLRVANGEIEAVITTDVGPRIIRFGFIGGENEFAEYPSQLGLGGDAEYRSYGGHRLWIAPEDPATTYYPDNAPVAWERRGEALHLTAPVETSTQVQKSMEIWLDPMINTVHVIHRIRNCAPDARRLSAWSLSVMAPGGRAIIPHEPYLPHPTALLPVRPLALWSYTALGDQRFRWGRRFLQIRQDPSAPSPQKIGLLNKQGWAGYLRGGTLFTTTVPYLPGAEYPDFQSNLEVFTNARMLELETLSPLTTLPPGATLQHEEHWFLLRGVPESNSEEEIDDAVHRCLGDG